ncbi:30S ribosomal protein S3 [Candidatus Berkelbacteria bacterium CG08_land_8_20_14_0_20_39_8]|uniref:Small ribosomal subunit protein uS3 n=1 Tax=Candidatus Berkelbacteria bacterium CG08_land_8_20_14_0_20_39_8 TaxID=1974511 RepID=A0A2M6YCG5_9BACT|nr:MAG: 30S ribosomal protein S3 [Candidatus Berkelbacteria bacterium CG08_land_8_20_14_0_20_39_8]
MGQKVNPTSWRMKINETWKSRWFGGAKYTDMLHEDLAIRKHLNSEYKSAAISRIDISRDANKVAVTIKTARPGVIIGRGGSGAEKIKAGVEKLIHGNKVKINIEEVRNSDGNASVVAQNIAAQIEKRMPYRRAMKQAIEKAEQSGVKGIKVQVSGRLNGAEIARSEKSIIGLVPLSTLKSQIDYAYIPAHTTYGIIGIKVWIYKGDSESVDFTQPESNK